MKTSKYDDAIDGLGMLALTAPEELLGAIQCIAEYLDEQDNEIYTAKMQLAACSAATYGNDPKSIRLYRLSKDDPYYTEAYKDVCNAVDREIDLRTRLSLALEVIAKHIHETNEPQKKEEKEMNNGTDSTDKDFTEDAPAQDEDFSFNDVYVPYITEYESRIADLEYDLVVAEDKIKKQNTKIKGLRQALKNTQRNGKFHAKMTDYLVASIINKAKTSL